MKTIFFVATIAAIPLLTSCQAGAATVKCWPYFDGIEMQVACNRDERAIPEPVVVVTPEPPHCPPKPCVNGYCEQPPTYKTTKVLRAARAVKVSKAKRERRGAGEK